MILNENSILTRINLSDNQFVDRDAKILSKAIQKNQQLLYVDLSKNEFGSIAGEEFGRMIGENEILVDLNLSWNQIRQKGAVEIAKGIRENMALKRVDLSWNGFGDLGAVAISDALRYDTGLLTELDLTCNRIGAKGFLNIIQAVTTGGNEHIKILRIGRNPISESAATTGIQLLIQMQQLTLILLDMNENIYGQKFTRFIQGELKEAHPGFTCTYGYTDAYGTRRLKVYNAVEDALRMMKTYCDEHCINIVELFSRFDADGSMSVTHEEFKLGLKEAKMPLKDSQIEELINALDQDGDGEIDFGEMVLGAEMLMKDSED